MSQRKTNLEPVFRVLAALTVEEREAVREKLNAVETKHTKGEASEGKKMSDAKAETLRRYKNIKAGKNLIAFTLQTWKA